MPCGLISPAEKLYSISDCELLALKLALEDWHHLLEGAKFPGVSWSFLEYLQSVDRLTVTHIKHFGHSSSHNSILLLPNIQQRRFAERMPFPAPVEPARVIDLNCIITNVRPLRGQSFLSPDLCNKLLPWAYLSPLFLVMARLEMGCQGRCWFSDLESNRSGT